MSFEPQNLVLTKARRERIAGGLNLISLAELPLMGTAIWQFATGQLWLGIWLSVPFLALMGGNAIARAGLQ